MLQIFNNSQGLGNIPPSTILVSRSRNTSSDAQNHQCHTEHRDKLIPPGVAGRRLLLQNCAANIEGFFRQTFLFHDVSSRVVTQIFGKLPTETTYASDEGMLDPCPKTEWDLVPDPKCQAIWIASEGKLRLCEQMLNCKWSTACSIIKSRRCGKG